MLRIDDDDTGSGHIRLEGSLQGPWVDELERLVRARPGRASGIVFDVSALGFVDPTGARLLRALREGGMRLVGVTPYIAALLAGLEGGSDE